VIRFTNVCMMFHGRPILKDFTLEVPSGHTMVILGGSGGGKTTVLRLILGLLRPDSGSIRVDGKDIVGLPERNMVPIRARMAMVFQGSALFDSLTVRENVAIASTRSRPFRTTPSNGRSSSHCVSSGWKTRWRRCRPNSAAA